MIQQVEFRAMGCRMSAALDGPEGKAARKLEDLPAWFEGWERCLSRFREDSELSELNRSAGSPVQVSHTLWEVFLASLDAYQASSGLATPAVLETLVSAGYDRSWEMIVLAGGGPAGSLPQPVPALEEVDWDTLSRTICLPAGVRLDFGGIAKGWAAQEAMLRLQSWGPALVDAGGDIAISGLQAGGQPWPVGVVDPFQPEADLELLRLGRCGVATSGRDFHRWRREGAWQHHLIDPRTGRPAESDVLSATVVAPTAPEAEMAAKTVLILGSQAGLGWLEARPAFAGLLVLENGVRLYSRLMERFLWR
jgi:thiamine biosynthesis lipoprotein